MEAKTPTKRTLSPGGGLSPVSPKFMKPSDVFQRRMTSRCGSTKFFPSKTTASVRRCKLPIETVEKIYSPLKCLRPTRNVVSPGTKSKQTGGITFSPLMKKLQRSPRQNGSISFPVVKRSLAAASKRPPIGRVLHFSEDAQWPAAGRGDLWDATPQIDWSLKTRLRVVVNRALTFHGTFSSVDEAAGMNRFVRGGDSPSGDDLAPGTAAPPESTFCAELQRHCLVWQHPHLPWMRLFPREPELRPGSSLEGAGRVPPVFTISPNGALADSLHSDFCGALHSLFKLVKAKYCPYFYVCANNFVALFRASGVAGADEAHALVVPTTAGFRRLLSEESIQFEMPFHKQQANAGASDSKHSESSSGIEPDLNAEEDSDPDEDGAGDHQCDQTETEEESNQWLESLGLSQQDFPSLKTNAFRRRGRVHRDAHIDDQTARGKVKSLVRVNGIHQLQSLLAIFINHRKTCVASSGPLAGIPPTLLAPVAFHKATLTPLAVRQKSSTAGGGNDRSVKHLSTIDVSGPVLPHTVYGLMRLFRRLLEHSGTVVRGTLKTYDPAGSLALESVGTPPQTTENSAAFSVENLYESGLDRDLLRAICSRQRQSRSPLLDFELSANGIRYNRFSHGSQHHTNTTTDSKTTISVFGS